MESIMVDDYNTNLDRRRAVVIQLQPHDLSLKQWYDWLTDQGLELGRDYCWSWYNDNMAIELTDPGLAVMTQLKMHD
jgi:hypothetical protein